MQDSQDSFTSNILGIKYFSEIFKKNMYPVLLGAIGKFKKKSFIEIVHKYISPNLYAGFLEILPTAPRSTGYMFFSKTDCPQKEIIVRYMDEIWQIVFWILKKFLFSGLQLFFNAYFPFLLWENLFFLKNQIFFVLRKSWKFQILAKIVFFNFCSFHTSLGSFTADINAV